MPMPQQMDDNHIPPPTTRHVYAVRWRRQGARPDVMHRICTRRVDADRLAPWLRARGRQPVMYAATATWEEVSADV